MIITIIIITYLLILLSISIYSDRGCHPEKQMFIIIYLLLCLLLLISIYSGRGCHPEENLILLF